MNKLTPNYDPIPYIVIAKKGSMTTAERRRPFHSVTRYVSYFEKLKYTDKPESVIMLGDREIRIGCM